MAVLTVTTATIKPDRFEDYVAQGRQVKAILEKQGGKNVRLLAALVAGEATGSVAFIVETDDFATTGEVMDKFYADPESLAMMASMTGGAGSLATYQTSMWVDIPL